MFDYPLTTEATTAFPVPAATNLELRAWELHLKAGVAENPEADEKPVYTVPADLGPGYVAFVWDGNAVFTPRDESVGINNTIESGLDIVLLENV